MSFRERIDIVARLRGANEIAREAWKATQAMRATSAATKDLDRNLGRVHQRSFAFNQAMFTARRTLYGLTLGMVGAATAAATLGLKFNTTMQQNRVALEFLTGSAEEANKEVEFLFDLAKETLFSPTDLTELSRQFLGWGFSIEQANRMLTVTADTMAGLGGDVTIAHRIARALGQIQSKGRLMGQEMLQLSEAGVQVLPLMAEQAGVTTQQMAKMAEQGIAADKAIDLLLGGMDKKFGGASARLVGTVAGQMEKLKDVTSQLMGAIMLAPFAAIQKNFPHLLDTMEQMNDAMREGGFFAMVAVLDRNAGAGGRLSQTLQHLHTVMQDLSVIAQGPLWTAIKNNAWVMWQFMKPILLISGAILSLAAFFKAPLSVILTILIGIWITHRLVVFKNWIMLRRYNGTLALSVKWVWRKVFALKAWVFHEKLIVDRVAGTTTMVYAQNGALAMSIRWIWGVILATKTWIADLIMLRIVIFNIPLLGWLLAIVAGLILLETKWGLVSKSIKFLWDMFKRLFNWIKNSGFGKVLGKILGGAAKVIGAVGGFIGLQHGGVVTNQGGFVVGERGPELVHLPRGAAVQPVTGKSLDLAGATGGGGVTVVVQPQHITLDGRQIAEIVWKHKLDRFARR